MKAFEVIFIFQMCSKLGKTDLLLLACGVWSIPGIQDPTYTWIVDSSWAVSISICSSVQGGKVVMQTFLFHLLQESIYFTIDLNDTYYPSWHLTYIQLSNAKFHIWFERTLMHESFQSCLIMLYYAQLFIGFKVGVEKHSTEVIVKKSGSLLINSGIQGYSLLKTTQVTLQIILLCY
jgi:hypothetical protein